MAIEKFFKDIIDKKREMQKALKKYIEATEDFHTITGVKYTDMPKSKGKALGFDDLMANIEDLYEEYLTSKSMYDDEYKKCMIKINKLNDPTHKLIIEYAFIDEKKDKEITNTLKEFHNIDYSYSHVRRIKSIASKEFKLLIATL